MKLAQIARHRTTYLFLATGLCLSSLLGCALGQLRAGSPIYTLATVSEAAPLLKYDRAECERVFGQDFYLEEAQGGLKCVRENLDPELQRAMSNHRFSYHRLQAQKNAMSRADFERGVQKIEEAVDKSVQLSNERHACPNGSTLGTSDTPATVRCESPVYSKNESGTSLFSTRAPASIKKEKEEEDRPSRPCVEGWTYLEIAPARGDDALKLCASCTRGTLDTETTHELNQDERKFRIAGCPTDRPCVVCKHNR